MFPFVDFKLALLAMSEFDPNFHKLRPDEDSLHSRQRAVMDVWTPVLTSTGEAVRSVCGLSECGVPQPQGPPPPSRRLCPPDKTLATPRGRPFHSRRSISFCPRQNFFSAPFSCFSALDPASTPSTATPGFEKKLQFCECDFKLFGDIFVSGGNRRWTLDIVSVGKCSILHFSIQLNYTNNMYMHL